MALETATYINQLVSTNPLGSDPVASGDDHIRLIKSAVKATFPNITGPVSLTQADLNGKVPNAVQKDGSVAMTGELPLSGNPATALGATPKQYVDAADAALQSSKADKATTITGTGAITGGGDLSANRTLDLATTGVTAGTYGSTTKYAKITVNSKGQVTAAEEITIPTAKGLGMGGEVWNNVTSSRALDTDYTNSRSYPIMVAVSLGPVNSSIALAMYVGGVLVEYQQHQFNGTADRPSASVIVPAGATYKATAFGPGGPIANWAELY